MVAWGCVVGGRAETLREASVGKRLIHREHGRTGPQPPGPYRGLGKQLSASHVLWRGWGPPSWNELCQISGLDLGL